MSRYPRQEILSEVGAEGQARLAEAKPLVVGAGGLGSALRPLLAGAGVVFACATGLRDWRAARRLSTRSGKPAAILAVGP